MGRAAGSKAAVGLRRVLANGPPPAADLRRTAEDANDEGGLAIQTTSPTIRHQIDQLVKRARQLAVKGLPEDEILTRLLSIGMDSGLHEDEVLRAVGVALERKDILQAADTTLQRRQEADAAAQTEEEERSGSPPGRWRSWDRRDDFINLMVCLPLSAWQKALFDQESEIWSLTLDEEDPGLVLEIERRRQAKIQEG